MRLHYTIMCSTYVCVCVSVVRLLCMTASSDAREKLLAHPSAYLSPRNLGGGLANYLTILVQSKPTAALRPVRHQRSSAPVHATIAPDGKAGRRSSNARAASEPCRSSVCAAARSSAAKAAFGAPAARTRSTSSRATQPGLPQSALVTEKAGRSGRSCPASGCRLRKRRRRRGRRLGVGLRSTASSPRTPDMLHNMPATTSETAAASTHDARTCARMRKNAWLPKNRHETRREIGLPSAFNAESFALRRF